MKWNNVEGKLPEYSGHYICYIEELNDLGISKYVFTCHYHSDREFDNWTIDGEPIMRVLDWMPLPDKPTNR